VHRRYRPRHPSGIPAWGQASGWDQPLPGWSPLLDHGPPSLRIAGSVARWWWPTLAVAGFLAVVAYVTGHDHTGPSNRGLLTIALAALVVVLLTIHRTAGPRPLARAVAEYTAVALLAGLLALAGGVDQQTTEPTSPAAKAKAATNKSTVDADHRPGVLRVAAGVARAVTRAIRAVTGAAGWVAELWRQADATTDRPNPPSPTTTPKAEAMAPPPPCSRRPGGRCDPALLGPQPPR
jgi:hypothetical protein